MERNVVGLGKGNHIKRHRVNSSMQNAGNSEKHACNLFVIDEVPADKILSVKL